MSTPWEEQKEFNATNRIEYTVLDLRFRFVQGLRFLILGGSVTINAYLFGAFHTYSRIIRELAHIPFDRFIWTIIAISGLMISLFTGRIDAALERTLRNIADRAAIVEGNLDIPRGTFGYLVADPQRQLIARINQ